MKLQLSLLAVALFGAIAMVNSCPCSSSLGMNPLLGSCGSLNPLLGSYGSLSPASGFSTLGLSQYSLGSLGLLGGGCGAPACGKPAGLCGCNNSKLVVGLKLPSLKEKILQKLQDKYCWKCKKYSSLGSDCGC